VRYEFVLAAHLIAESTSPPDRNRLWQTVPPRRSSLNPIAPLDIVT